MSNVRYRGENLSERIRSEALIRRCVEMLVSKRGRGYLAAAAMCSRVLDSAMKCRESDHQRLVANPNATREKGERPIVTVSEGRLNARDMTRYHDALQELRERIQREVEAYVERMEVRGMAELKLALDALSEEPQSELADFVNAPEVREVVSSLRPEDQRMLAQAVAANDREAASRIVTAQPQAVRVKLQQALKLAA